MNRQLLDVIFSLLFVRVEDPLWSEWVSSWCRSDTAPARRYRPIR